MVKRMRYVKGQNQKNEGSDITQENAYKGEKLQKKAQPPFFKHAKNR
jgi:hypothetical protein